MVGCSRGGRSVRGQYTLGFSFPPGKVAEAKAKQEAWDQWREDPNKLSQAQLDILEHDGCWMTMQLWSKYNTDPKSLSKEEREMLESGMAWKTKQVWDKYNTDHTSLSEEERLILINGMAWKSHKKSVLDSEYVFASAEVEIMTVKNRAAEVALAKAEMKRVKEKNQIIKKREIVMAMEESERMEIFLRILTMPLSQRIQAEVQTFGIISSILLGQSTPIRLFHVTTKPNVFVPTDMTLVQFEESIIEAAGPILQHTFMATDRYGKVSGQVKMIQLQKGCPMMMKVNTISKSVSGNFLYKGNILKVVARHKPIVCS